MVGSRSGWLPYAAPVAISGVLAIILLSSGGLVVYRYFNDALVVMDAMWRASLGQTPHIDFPSPIGQAYFWPFALLGNLGDVKASMLLQANVLVAAVALAMACLTLPRRMSPLPFALAVLTVVTVAMSPRDLDGGYDSYAFLAPYNTWGWALVALPGLIALQPPRNGATTGGVVLDGAVLGLVLGLLLYLKITFFLPAIAFVVIGLVLRHLSLSTAAIAAVVAVAIAAAVELTFHNNAAYLADLRLVAEVNVDSDANLRLSKLVKSVLLAAVGGGGLVAALWLLNPDMRLRRWLLGHWRAILVAAVLMGGGALIASQNHPKVQLTLIGIGAVVALQLAHARSDRQEADPSPLRQGSKGRALRALGWLIVVGLVAPAPVLDTLSIVGHAFESRGGRACALPGLRGFADDLLVKRQARFEKGRAIGPASCDWILAASPLPYMNPHAGVWERRSINTIQNVDAGMRLVEKHAGKGEVILAAAFANPFPMLTRTSPPSGAAIWWDYGRDYSKARQPPAQPMLQSSTMVMQDLDTLAGRNFWSVYGDAIARSYRPVEETPRWRVWKRRDVLASGS
jgi:hypothetical protein